MSKYLDRLPDQRRERDRELLTALAYARGAGLDDPAWLAFADALSYSASVVDLDALRYSPAADFLLQTTTAEHGARPVTRLFHQALTDELLVPRHQPSDEAALLDMLLRQVEQTGWQDRYLREHAAEHATAAGRLDQLLEDPLYLLAVDPARLVPHLDTARSATARATATVYRQSAHHLAPLDQAARASQLELTAHQLGCHSLAVRIGDASSDRPWHTRWSHGRRTTGHQVLTGHTGPVSAVAVGALPDGTPVIVSSGGPGDSTVRVWRLADGTPVGQPLRGHTNPVNAVAVGALPDGTPVIVSGSGIGGAGDDTVRVWRLADGTPVGEPLAGHDGGVSAVAVGALPDGTPVIVSGGYAGTVQVWRLADGIPVGEPLAGHTGSVWTVAVGALQDGIPVIVSGGDSTVRVWRLADGTPVGEPLVGHDGGVSAVGAGVLPDGAPVIVSGGGDGTVRVWRLADGTAVGEPLVGHDGLVALVAVGVLPDGTAAIVSGSGSISGGSDGTVRVWRLADGTPVGGPLVGHDSGVYAVTIGVLPDGAPVIVSGGGDGTVRVWRLADGTPVGEPLRGHNGNVNAVAVGALPDGTPVIVSGSRDTTVRIWRLADGTPVGEPLVGQDGDVNAVAVGALPDGAPVIVSGSGDGTVWVWRLADGIPVIVSGSDHGRMWAWRLADGAPVIIHDDRGRIWGWLVDGIGMISNENGRIRVRRLIDGTPVIVNDEYSGFCYIYDSTVRVWRLADGIPAGGADRGHDGRVNTVAVGEMADGTLVIVSGGDDSDEHYVSDGTVRVWRLADGTPVVPPLRLPEPVRAVAVHGNVIVTAAGADIAVHQLALPRPMR